MTPRRVTKAPYKIRGDLTRKTFGSVVCPLGVYPCDESAVLEEGYEGNYIRGEGEDGEDQYEFRAIVSNDRLFFAVRYLLEELMPDEVYGLFEELSHDAFRETDAHRSNEPLARDRIIAAWDTYGDYFIEDGKSGFGCVAYDPMIEIFLEEHGSLYIACGIVMKARVDEALETLGLEEGAGLLGIENYEHQHREVLALDEDGIPMMDEGDIKFSVLESLGMQPINRDEGEPSSSPTPFWVHLELDLSFVPESSASGAFVSFGLTAPDHETALALVEQELLRIQPAALIARALQVYRLADSDIGEDIAPAERGDLRNPGVWYASELHYWS